MTDTNAISLNQDASLASFIQVANSAPVLSQEDEYKLAKKYQDEQDVESARKLVVSHLRNVIHVAKRFTGYGLPVADLIQEGNIGLMKAVKNYNPDHGVRLVSYAVHWIKAEIYEYVLKNWKMVKVATTKAQRKLFFNLRKSRKSLASMTAKETKQLAEDLDVPEKTVREMEVRMTSTDVAFDGPDNDDEFVSSPSGYLPDMRYNPEELVIANQTESNNNNALHGAIAKLDDRSRDILLRRWLNDENKATLNELADEYGVSAERIRQIEKRAMEKIKTEMAS